MKGFKNAQFRDSKEDSNPTAIRFLGAVTETQLGEDGSGYLISGLA